MKQRILFVEDNPVLLQMYETMMSSELDAWGVATAADGQEALGLITQGPFDVIVSDMRMPGMSGVELLQEVRNLHPQTSRVIISGIGDQEEIADSMARPTSFSPSRSAPKPSSPPWRASADSTPISKMKNFGHSSGESIPCPAFPHTTCKS